MTAEFAQIVPAPRDEVWRWFAAPGAMTRLTPPFLGMHVERETDDLSAGTSALRPNLPSPLPALGPRWVAQHVPEGYEEGRSFRDVATSLPWKLTGWTHHHGFEEADDATLVTDRVDARVPRRLLESMIDFRHIRLDEDLEALQRSRVWGAAPRTIAVTGASGLVGTQLTALLTTSGHRVIRLVRGTPSGPDERRWDPDDPADDLLDGVDALVHLAGASIAGRFTDEHRRRIRDSRIGPTAKLAALVARAGTPVFVTASAVGVYGADRGDEVLDEQAAGGDGFLADVVRDWEAAADPARATARVVHVRTGIVLTSAGGVLGLLGPIHRLGLGGPLGDGRQWFPWIGLDDLLDVYRRAVLDERLAGPVNAVAPGIVRMGDFSKILGRVLRRPAVLPVPKAAPAVLLGRQGADELALANQRVTPSVLTGLGHTFRHPDLASALRLELGRFE